jgi:hypothetical protein
MSDGQQAVQTVKVVIHQPEPEKPKRKRKKKKDTKKDEAIEQLKEELQSYDEVQNQAGEAGIDIPSELGVSPAEASALKSADDIKQFIEAIQQKREAIQQLLTQPPQPARRPNRFIDIPRPPVIPAVVPQFIPTQIQPQPLPGFIPPAGPPAGPPGVRPEVAKQIEDLEAAEKAESLKLRKTESIERFETKAQRSPAEANTILDNIEVARKANNGVLTQEQLNNFITQLEEVGNRYNAQFSKLSPQSQALLAERREKFINELNVEIKKLKQELRTGQPPLPPAPTKETWKPKEAMGRPLIEEYLALDLDKVEISPSQANILETALRGMGVGDELFKELAKELDPKKRQNDIRETLQAIDQAKKEDIKAKQAIESETKPAKQIWQPQSNIGIPLLTEYASLDLDKISTSANTDALVIRSIERDPNITVKQQLIAEVKAEKDPKEKQTIIKEVLDAFTQEKLIRERTKEEQQPKPEPEPEEIEAEKEASIQKARKDLTGYVEGTGRKGFKNWGTTIQKALRTIGISDAEIKRIGEIPSPQGKKQTVKDILTPVQECAPGSRRGVCIPPAKPATPAKPSKRLIQTTSYPEFLRLQRQYAGDPNTIVQAPQAVIQRQSDIDPGDRANLSASRFRIP